MAAQSESFDVAVVGGGAIGLACAWRAAQRGARSSCSTPASPARGTSPRACSRRSPRPSSASARCCSSGWRARAATRPSVGELDDAGYRAVGTLVVARDRDEAEALDRLAEFRRGLGLPVERLRPSQARRLEPALAPTIRLALDIASDHSVDPRKLVAALRRKRHARLGRRARATGLAGRGRARDRRDHARGHGARRQGRRRRGRRRRARSDMPEHARVPVRPVKGQVLRLRDPERPRPRRAHDPRRAARTSSRAATAATCSARRWRSAAGTRSRPRAASTSCCATSPSSSRASSSSRSRS